uniref:Uncharacterized protein n=1 Tax=Globodera rostochiensis TaxID=31243 RepID=A0A914I688_GLORO
MSLQQQQKQPLAGQGTASRAGRAMDKKLSSARESQSSKRGEHLHLLLFFTMRFRFLHSSRRGDDEEIKALCWKARRHVRESAVAEQSETKALGGGGKQIGGIPIHQLCMPQGRH